ncbi:MAG: carbohydrate ABC transporter permease [Oscillospiraceae bacterium]|nr:carbohydrate ABC transporter permease [Oscillospiraceae bacterium]
MSKNAPGKNKWTVAYTVFQYIVCILLTCLSLLPFIIMIVNATRSSAQIQAHAISFLPGTNFSANMKVLTTKTFHPLTGFFNSAIIAVSATFLSVYFSTMTAYSIVAYDWKFKKAFFALIMAVLMIPTQVSSIGFYQFMYKINMTNNFLALILPAIAAPATVFFMRQYMIPALPMSIVQSARIDGASEFRTFNQIVIPMCKPGMATQAIFTFVTQWNNLFMPMILLTEKDKWTMPMMVSQLSGDMYKTEYGAVYLGLLLTVLPIFVIYFILSKYIIAGVALGGVKE